ncbi:MAG TPA: hypothetical protein DCF89_10715 [Flavobacteriales bacterium]|nr:hypothetical protein [Crocinitomicaceae bacterium]HAE31576.1 hypothetical protein [Flavobacteriales bacterium]
MRLILFLLICSTGLTSLAQDKEASNSLEGVPFSQRLYTGGDLGFSFGNITFVNINPIVGYRIDKKWSAGISAKYIYYRERFPEYNWEYSNSMYGGSVFTRYLIGNSFLAHAEFEAVNAEVREFLSTTLTRKWVPIGLLGAGYRQGLGNTYLQVLVLYDAINNRNSPYRNEYLFGPTNIPLILRAGFIIGLGN